MKTISPVNHQSHKNSNISYIGLNDFYDNDDDDDEDYFQAIYDEHISEFSNNNDNDDNDEINYVLERNEMSKDGIQKINGNNEMNVKSHIFDEERKEIQNYSETNMNSSSSSQFKGKKIILSDIFTGETDNESIDSNYIGSPFKSFEFLSGQFSPLSPIITKSNTFGIFILIISSFLLSSYIFYF
jgi:hypothetical protein